MCGPCGVVGATLSVPAYARLPYVVLGFFAFLDEEETCLSSSSSHFLTAFLASAP